MRLFQSADLDIYAFRNIETWKLICIDPKKMDGGGPGGGGGGQRQRGMGGGGGQQHFGGDGQAQQPFGVRPLFSSCFSPVVALGWGAVVSLVVLPFWNDQVMGVCSPH
jgi:hypothetical protein